MNTMPFYQLAIERLSVQSTASNPPTKCSDHRGGLNHFYKAYTGTRFPLMKLGHLF